MSQPASQSGSRSGKEDLPKKVCRGFRPGTYVPAARRLVRTVRTGLGGPSASGRAVLALALAGLFLYGFYRAGEQVTGGLDPNFTVNAWGGPTYLGAMACHYLDLLVLMGAAAWMLHLILLPDPANAAADSPARSHAFPRRCGASAGRRFPDQR